MEIYFPNKSIDKGSMLNKYYTNIYARDTTKSRTKCILHKVHILSEEMGKKQVKVNKYRMGITSMR